MTCCSTLHQSVTMKFTHLHPFLHSGSFLYYQYPSSLVSVLDTPHTLYTSEHCQSMKLFYPSASYKKKCIVLMHVCMFMKSAYWLCHVCPFLCSFVMSARFSVCNCQFGMHWKDFWEIGIGVLYGNLSRKSKFG